MTNTIKIKVDVDTDEAIQKIRQLRDELGPIHRIILVWYFTCIGMAILTFINLVIFAVAFFKVQP